MASNLASSEAPGPLNGASDLRIVLIHDITAPSANPNATLSDALNGLGLHVDANDQSLRPKAKRYRKLTTMTAADMLETGTEKLKELLTKSQEEEQQQPTTTTSSNNPKKRAAAGPAARYEQVRRRRGLTNFEVTESAPDPLKGIGKLFDVVRMDVDDSQHQSLSAGGGSGVLNEERDVMKNYMPMVREYLDKPENDSPEDDDGYVYDLYIEAETNFQEEEGNLPDESEDKDLYWEMYTQGNAPVVQILDEDTWLVKESQDQEDSDADSEDSNAEDFYGNDYPEEEEDGDGFWGSDSDDGDGYVGGGYGSRKKEWFDESGEGSSDGDYH